LTPLTFNFNLSVCFSVSGILPGKQSLWLQYSMAGTSSHHLHPLSSSASAIRRSRMSATNTSTSKQHNHCVDNLLSGSFNGKSLPSSADNCRRQSSRIRSLSTGKKSSVVEGEPCVNDVLSLPTSVLRRPTVTASSSTKQRHSVSERKRRRTSIVEQDRGQKLTLSSSVVKSHSLQASDSREEVDEQEKVSSRAKLRHKGRDCCLELNDADFVARRTRRSSAVQRRAELSSGAVSYVQEKPGSVDADRQRHPAEIVVPAKRARLSRCHAVRRQSRRSVAVTELSTDAAASNDPKIQRRVFTGTSVMLPGRVGKRRSAGSTQLSVS